MGRYGAHAQGSVGEPGRPGLRGNRVRAEGDQAGHVQGGRPLYSEEVGVGARGDRVGRWRRRARHPLGTELPICDSAEGQKLDAQTHRGEQFAVTRNPFLFTSVCARSPEGSTSAPRSTERSAGPPPLLPPPSGTAHSCSTIRESSRSEEVV